MRYADLFPNLPDDAHCWIYAAGAPLDDDQQARLLGTFRSFLDGWTSHNRRVVGDADVLSDRFLVVAAVVPGGDVSGCGIDKSARAVEDAAHEAGVTWVSPLAVFWRDADGTVQHAGRGAFRRLAQAGAVHSETPVFDLGVSTLGAVRGGAFEQPAGQAWHARIFPLVAPAA